MTATAMTARRVRVPTAVERVTLSSARDDRLYFAQVREDPRVELAALHPQPSDRVVVVSSGGCTALSLLGTGAAEVHAVDVNRSQNHLVELKAAAVRELSRGEAIGFMGGSSMIGIARVSIYKELRPRLTDAARVYWDRRLELVERGILDAGVSERFISLVCWLVSHVVHSTDLVGRMLACRSLDEQRDLFDREWNTRRWRWVFAALLNRWSMSRAYDARFFERLGRRNFAEHFLKLANHVLTDVPIADNYFLRKMFAGSYAVEHPAGVPPYLAAEGARAIAQSHGALLLVDGSVTEHLRSLPDASVHCFALSNICEWLSESEIADLFVQVERVAAPGARVVFRNFVGWTDLPAACSRLEENVALGEKLIRGDRSGVQSRVVVCEARDP